MHNPELNSTFLSLERNRMCVIKRGYDVMGGYMSPVNDKHKKKDLASAKHRMEMSKLAAETSDMIMVDEWEARQPAYQRSIVVLSRIIQHLNRAVGEGVECPTIKVCALNSLLLQGMHSIHNLCIPWNPEHIIATNFFKFPWCTLSTTCRKDPSDI